ncbi:MAG: metallophosphoesterase family protein [Candidatus Eremiobacteraeota bacterium]|nr:metallophosphoesterase family protein [Candidatus Eremiobacteraeota bacterium]MBV9276907.1 metallophosphoesterase family protein [Candidatus Eremiobacteraeota bacterium]
MRYAIVSDVHSNLESLGVMLEMLRDDDGLLCLGDIVGYGPNPNECVDLIRRRATEVVLGNHDVAATDNFGVEYFNPFARNAIEWTQREISKDSVEWLNTLSYEIRTPEYLMVHGAPKHYFEYILDKRAASRAFKNTDAPLIFVGHTHIADYYTLQADGTIDHAHMQNGGSLTLAEGARYIINAGSVGQPRDLNPKAAFAWYDDAQKTIEFVRYDYPIATVQEKIRAAGLPEALATRLDAGR